jgi:hypothetical protein
LKPLALIDWPMHLKAEPNERGLRWQVKAARVSEHRKQTKIRLLANGIRAQLVAKHGQLQPDERYVVAFVRVASRRLDDDNLQGAFKAIRDEVAAYLGVNDGDRQRIRFEYADAKGRPSAVQIAFAVERVP